MRWKKLLGVMLVIVAAGGLLLWWLGTKATVEDGAPLPQGPVNRPVGFGQALVSRLFLNVKMDLGVMEKGLKSIPPKKVEQSDPKVDATLKLLDAHLEPAAGGRLGARAKLQMDGGIKWLGFTAKDITANAEGDLAISISPQWEWSATPNLKGSLEKIDVQPLLPDWAAKWAANLVLVVAQPWLGQYVEDVLPSPKAAVKDLWKQARQRVTVLHAPRVEVSCEPEKVLLRQPVIDRKSNDLDLGLGVEGRVLADVSSAAHKAAAAATPPGLPPITTTDPGARDSTLLLPLMIELDEVERHFQPQRIAWDDGHLEVSAIEFGDKAGVLHARIRFDAELPTAYTSFALRQLSGTIAFQVKPSCDPATGTIKLQDFDFAQATDSRLVNLVGSAARSSLKNLIQEQLPLQLEDTLRDLQTKAQAEANYLLAQLRDGLAASNQQFGELIRSARLEVAGLQVRPQALQVREGYLLCVARVDARLSITVE